MGNRAKSQEYILKYIEKLTPGTNNVDMYKTMFDKMSDRQYEAFIDKLESGEITLSVEMPNFEKKELSVERNFQIAKEIGHEFFQQLWIEGKDGMPTYLTPIPYMVLDLPMRRASQQLTKKISVPKNNKVIDALTGQPTGESKGAKISYPELQVCAAMGLESSLVELLKYRGGDARGRAAMNGMLSRYGQARQESLKAYASGVESTATLKTFLTSAHLKNTL